MASFEYQAIRVENDKEKSFVGGVVVARTPIEAEEKLLAHGLYATMLKRDKGLLSLLNRLDADIR